MCLWHREPIYDQDTPCTHVLIFGISQYSELPDDQPSTNPDLLGLTSLSTPAISAFKLANWFKDTYHNVDSPLGSVRLLISPSQKEIDNEPELAKLNHPLPTRGNIEQALEDWQKDCCKHRDNVAVLYASGHGVRLSKDSGIILLEDFGKGPGGVLSGAIDIGNVHQAMTRDDAAKNQFYFVDACAISKKLFSHYLNLKPGIDMDALRGQSVESSPIFFGAAPETVALGDPGEGTLFMQGLLQCLKCDAAVANDVNNPTHWDIHTQELFKRLRYRVNEIAQRQGDTQSVVLGGLSADAFFHQLPEPPQVPLHICLIPKDAALYAHYQLTSLYTDALVDDQMPFKTPHTSLMKPGVYKLHFNMTPNAKGYSSRGVPVLIISPPEVSKEIKL